VDALGGLTLCARTTRNRRSRAGQDVYGFDSFRGLPEDWRLGYDAAAFAVDEVPDVPGAQIVQGMFADVLPGFLSEHPGAVAFVHVDSDLYSSAMTVLVHVGPRLVEGSVVLFDEYYNYPDWHRHEHRALLEYAERDPSRKDLRACASKLVSENVHVAKELVKGQFRVDVDSVNDLDCRLTAHRRTAHQRRTRAVPTTCPLRAQKHSKKGLERLHAVHGREGASLISQALCAS